MMQAGMFDARPHSRELVYILVAERAARALGDLQMHSNEMTLEQASAFACANTPRNWLRMDGNLVRSEQHLYLQQPGYGTSYLIGKIEIEKLLAERRQQLGEAFTMKRFMDEFNAAGLDPGVSAALGADRPPTRRNQTHAQLSAAYALPPGDSKRTQCLMSPIVRWPPSPVASALSRCSKPSKARSCSAPGSVCFLSCTTISRPPPNASCGILT